MKKSLIHVVLIYPPFHPENGRDCRTRIVGEVACWGGRLSVFRRRGCESPAADQKAKSASSRHPATTTYSVCVMADGKCRLPRVSRYDILFSTSIARPCLGIGVLPCCLSSGSTLPLYRFC